MRRRCSDPQNHAYERYGGRGIRVCDRWQHSFAAFYADMGARPSKGTIGRIDNDGNYEPSNCRWETMKEQNNNRCDTIRLVIDGTERSLVQWVEHFGIVTVLAARRRLKRGWSEKDAVTIPLGTNLLPRNIKNPKNAWPLGPRTKLSVEDVRAIQKDPRRNGAIAKEYVVNINTIWKARRRDMLDFEDSK